MSYFYDLLATPQGKRPSYLTHGLPRFGATDDAPTAKT